MAKKYVMHVISGTHWDREWRHTAEQSKLRLRDLIDETLELLEQKDTYANFCIDGGMIVLEDYLAIRPDATERIKKLVDTGRLKLVSWYTLPETFTVAPEALIRNLLKGGQMAKQFGGAMSSGYTATSYGQTSQLPQIYQGFDIETAMFYRGTNKFEMPSLFLWEAPDGSTLHTVRTFDEVTRTNWFFYVHQPLVVDKPARDLSYTFNRENCPVHMCDFGSYQKGFELLRETPDFKKDKESLKQAFDTIMEQALPYAVGKHILALNMEDNQAPFDLLPEMIDAMNEISGDVEIKQSSLDEYFDAVIKDSNDDELFVHDGELRFPAVINGFNALLGATHSSRIKLKILNQKCETLLMNHAEPLASIAAMYGWEYPTTILNNAWSFLLQNQAHDSICGAAVDQAHEDMLYRFSLAETVGQEVSSFSITHLFNKIDTASDFKPEDYTITLFNTTQFDREEVLALVIDLPDGQQGGIVDPATGVGGSDTSVEYYDIIDKDGKEYEYQELSKEKVQVSVERHLDTAGIKGKFQRRKVLLKADVPAMGYKTYALRPRGPRYVELPQNGPDRPLIARPSGILENEHIKVKINSNGTFDLTHKETFKVMEGMHYFTDSGEVGSAHVSRAPQRNNIRTTLGAVADITMLESNELRGVYRIDMTLKVPVAATLDDRDRRAETTDLPLTTWLTLEKGSRHLKIKTKLSNHARDHRLQVNFPTRVKTDYVNVESAFAVEKRCVRWTETKDNFEKFFPFQPMQNFVELNDGKFGVAFLNRGLREYEVQDDSERTMSLTLLRTHRAYMTANTEMTPEEFDQYTGLQCFGDLEAEYAIYPHTGDWDSGSVLEEAYNYKVDIKALQGVAKSGELPCAGSFFKITPANKIMLSAIKQAESGQGYILRVWNNSSDEVAAKIGFTVPVKSAKRLKLDETELEEVKLSKNEISFKIAAHKIETLLLQ